MKMGPITIPLAPLGIVILISAACQRHEAPQTDIVLEVARSFEDLFETPQTRGKRVYSKYCSVCHGSAGQGEGFNAYNLNPRPRDFTDTSFVSRLDRDLINETISEGGAGVGLSPLMPAWGHTLSAADIKYVTEYVIHLARSSPE